MRAWMTWMRAGTKTAVLLAAVPMLAGACAKEPEPIRVTVTEPLYCYQNLGEVTCYRTPYNRDERRQVNFQGPPPEAYPPPVKPPEPVLYAPAAVDYFVKDPEPVPKAAPQAAQDRPVTRSAPLPPPKRTAPTRVAPPDGAAN